MNSVMLSIGGFFSVLQSIEVGKVNAELKDGLLKLHLPKTEAAKPRINMIKRDKGERRKKVH